MPAAPVAAVPSRPDEVINIDARHAMNIFMVPEFVNDIYEYLRDKEQREMISGTYMSTQSEVKEYMRAKVVDWLVEVHGRPRRPFASDTLYLAIRYMDRYLSVRAVAKNKLQLLAVTSFLLATKVEEMYSPSVRDICHLTHDLYKPEEVVRMEYQLLRVLNWNVTIPTASMFLQRFVRAGVPRTTEVHTVASFLCELSLMDSTMCKYPPSLVAAAAVYLAMVMTKQGSWVRSLFLFVVLAGCVLIMF